MEIPFQNDSFDAHYTPGRHETRADRMQGLFIFSLTSLKSHYFIITFNKLSITVGRVLVNCFKLTQTKTTYQKPKVYYVMSGDIENPTFQLITSSPAPMSVFSPRVALDLRY